MNSRKQKPSKKAASGAAVIQVKQANAAQLTKEQRAFNKLTQRIDFLQNSIAAEIEKLDMLSAMYHKDVATKVVALGHAKIKLSHLLHDKRSSVKLSKAHNNKLDQVIFDLLDDACTVVEPDEDTKKLYDSYSNTSFDDEMDAQREIMADSFYEQFGVKIDPAHLDGDPDFEKIENDLRQQFEDMASNQKPSKKTKKQLEKEALEAKKDVMKKKSLRSIYISLVKILHPDTEPDATLKAEKEETMKKVTTAYENSDMVKLLQIEMQWVKTHEEQLAKADNDTLNTYIELLKDQVKDLEIERFNLRMNPRYMHVAQYQPVNLYAARDDLRQQSKFYNNLCLAVQASIRDLEHSANPIVAIKNCIEEFYEEDDLPFDDEFNL
jgi:hypothetical protein